MHRAACVVRAEELASTTTKRAREPDTQARREKRREVVDRERRLRRLLELLGRERSMQRTAWRALLACGALLLVLLPLLPLGSAARDLCVQARAVHAQHGALLQEWAAFFGYFGAQPSALRLPPHFSCPLGFGLAAALSIPADLLDDGGVGGGGGDSARLGGGGACTGGGGGLSFFLGLVASGAGFRVLLQAGTGAWRLAQSSRRARRARAAVAAQRQAEADALSERAFMQGLQVSLNYCRADGSFVFRTLFEVEEVRHLTTNGAVCRRLLRAARQTTAAFPFLHSIPEHEHRTINNLVLNAISDRFSHGHLAHAALAEAAGDDDSGIATQRLAGGAYCFGLTCERGGSLTRKLRVMVASESLLRRVGSMPTPRMRKPEHAARWETIRAMARVAGEEWGHRGEEGPVLSQVEIYVPLALVPWPESPRGAASVSMMSSPLSSPVRRRRRSPNTQAAEDEMERMVAEVTELLASPLAPPPAASSSPTRQQRQQRQQRQLSPPSAAAQAEAALEEAAEAAANFARLGDSGGGRSAGGDGGARGGLRGTIGGHGGGGSPQQLGHSIDITPAPRMLWPADASPGTAVAAIAAAAATEGRVAAAAAAAFVDGTTARTPPMPQTRRRLELRRARAPPAAAAAVATAAPSDVPAQTPADTAGLHAATAATTATVKRTQPATVVVKRAVF